MITGQPGPAALLEQERQVMPLYEHIVLARQDISGQQAEALVEDFKKIIEDNGGQVPHVEAWGLRPLAYRIRKNRKAHYTRLNIDAPHAAVAEMERQMRLNEDIIRFMTVRVEELSEEASPILTRRDRDRRDRNDRGDRDRGDRGDRGDRDRGERRDDRPRDDRPRAETPAEGAA